MNELNKAGRKKEKEKWRMEKGDGRKEKRQKVTCYGERKEKERKRTKVGEWRKENKGEKRKQSIVLTTVQ